MKRTSMDREDFIQFVPSFSKFLLSCIICFIVIDILSVPFNICRFYLNFLFKI